MCWMLLLGTQRKFEVERLEKFFQFMEGRKTKSHIIGGLVTGEYISILMVVLELSNIPYSVFISELISVIFVHFPYDVWQFGTIQEPCTSNHSMDTP